MSIDTAKTEDDARFVTQFQRACREARDLRSQTALRLAKTMMESDKFASINGGIRDDLREAYANAARFHFGVGGG